MTQQASKPCEVHMNMNKDSERRVYCTDCGKYLTYDEIVAPPLADAGERGE